MMCKQVCKQQRGLGIENGRGDAVGLSAGPGRSFICDRNRMAFHSGSELWQEIVSVPGMAGYKPLLSFSHAPSDTVSCTSLTSKGLDQMLKTTKKKLEKRSHPVPVYRFCNVKGDRFLCKTNMFLPFPPQEWIPLRVKSINRAEKTSCGNKTV